VVANAVAGFIYHMTSPQTKERRSLRRAENEHREKMAEVAKLERDLQYAESFILARQEVLDKSVALAQVKMLQDQTEREMRLSLRDQTGIHGLTPQSSSDQTQERMNALRKRIEDVRNQANGVVTPPQQTQEPAGASASFSSNSKDSGNGHHPQVPQNFP
jgi:hypothetical protein